MHFEDDPITDMHAKNIYLVSEAIASVLKIWSRLLVPSFPRRSRRIQLLSVSTQAKIEESEMFLSNIPVPILVFLASWLAAPLIYSLDKLAAMEDQRWILIAGVIVLPVFGLMSSVFVRESKAKHEPLFYGRSQLTHM